MPARLDCLKISSRPRRRCWHTPINWPRTFTPASSTFSTTLEHQKGEGDFRTTLESLISLASRAAELFERSKTEQKRQLLAFVFSNLRLMGYETTVGYDVIDYDNDSSVYLSAVKDGEVSALLDEVFDVCQRAKPIADVIDAGALGNGSPDDWSDLFSE
jgi:hypothetical protein